MVIYSVTREKDTVLVSIMFDRECGKYRFVNLTHPHICSCKFDTVQDAIKDMENEKKNGKVLYYEKIG